MEVKACSEHLRMQIATLKPQMLVLIGNTALQYFFPKLKIMSVHGKVLDPKMGVPTFPIIHPSAINRHVEWSDLLLGDLRNLREARRQATERTAWTPGPRVMR
jgi:uracil-DNA glycosylase family 4